MTNNISFHIIVPLYNSENYIEQNIKSIQKQNYNNFSVTIIDDASKDKSKEIILSMVNNDERFKLIMNNKNQGALFNIVNALSVKKNEPSKIVDVILDGDDYLVSEDVLDIVSLTYRRTKCLITYGSFISKSDKKMFGRKYPYRTILRNEFRTFPWLASHLRTFRHDLFLKVVKDDLKDENGKYYSVTWDQALMFPMLEMAGLRQESIPDALYIYNDENPICDHFLRRKEQIKIEKQIRRKTKYNTIDFPWI